MKNNYFLNLILISILFISSPLLAQDNCLDFDGNNDWVNLPFQNLTGNTQLTIEAWINADDITSGLHEIYRQNGSGIPAAYLLSFQNNGTVLSFGINTSTGYLELDVTITPSSYTGGWHHIAGVYDGSTMTLYVDGSVIGSAPKTGILSMITPTTHRIGVNVSAEYFNGRIDEVRLWTVARPLNDIINDMNCKLIGPITGLVAVYNLDETSGTIAADSSGSGFDGTLMNGPVWSTSTVALDCSVGIAETYFTPSVTLYPVPAKDVLSIESSTYFSKVKIIDLTGKTIKTASISENRIDISNLSKGVYFIQLSNTDHVVSQKFVK